MIDTILETSRAVKPRSLESVHLMIFEEMGELARAINRPARCTETALEELCDVMICVVDLMWLIKPNRTEKISNDVIKSIIEITDVDYWLRNNNAKYSIYTFLNLSLSKTKFDFTQDIWHGLFETISQMARLFMVLEPEMTKEQLVDKINETIVKKCNKWKQLTC